MFDSLQNITFVNPEAFFLLLLLPIIGAWYFFRRDSHFASLKMSSLESIQNISSWRGKFRVTLPIFRAIAFLMLVTALARPQETLKEEDIKAEGIDRVVCWPRILNLIDWKSVKE
jgi:Ca-activated chloride channel family protein